MNLLLHLQQEWPSIIQHEPSRIHHHSWLNTLNSIILQKFQDNSQMSSIKPPSLHAYQSLCLKIIATKGLDFCDISLEIRARYSKPLPSLVARKEISEYIWKFPDFDIEGKPIWEAGKYFSLSHSGQWVFVGVFPQWPIWVDIEDMKPRWEEIFGIHSKEEYELFSWNTRNRKSPVDQYEIFYRLWTIKEAVLKLFLSGIDALWDVILWEIANISFQKGDIVFDASLTGKFQWKSFVCFSGIDAQNNLAFSIAVQS
jgi:hypothetical protein